jgi:hypothetical protein
MSQSYLRALLRSKKAYNKNFYRWHNYVIDTPL